MLIANAGRKSPDSTDAEKKSVKFLNRFEKSETLKKLNGYKVNNFIEN